MKMNITVGSLFAGCGGMDAMYEDRLDQKISEADYDRRFADYTKQLENVEQRISKHNHADVSYYDFGHRILELAENAEKLAKAANPDEKRELVQFFLSNSTLKDGNPIFALKKPFLAIEKRSPCDDRLSWQGWREYGLRHTSFVRSGMAKRVCPFLSLSHESSPPQFDSFLV